MKIISKFNELYDRMEYLGVDPSIVYVRNTEAKHYPNLPKLIEKIAPTALPQYYIHGIRNNALILRPFYLFMCDRFYLFWKTVTQENYGRRKEVNYLWDLEEVENFYNKSQSESNQYRPLFKRTYWNNLKTKLEGDLPKNFKLNSKFDCPVIVSGVFDYSNTLINPSLYLGEDENNITLNPRLTTLNFHKKMGEVDVWQKISMFLSRDKEVPNTTRSEKTDLMRHGMDKNSFRRDSHPRKPRSKNKK
jgi:hypothetical protein